MEDRVPRDEADERPLGVLVGHARGVERKGRRDGVDVLGAHCGAADLEEPVVRGRVEREGVARAPGGVGQRAAAELERERAVGLLEGEREARLFVAVELVDREEPLCQVIARDLDADHAHRAAPHLQGHGVGDHAVVVLLAVPEHERVGPEPEVLGVDGRVLERGLVGAVVEVVRRALAVRREVDRGHPGGVERDAEGLRETLLAPLEEQVGVRLRARFRVGVADEQPDVARRPVRPLVVRQDDEGARARVAARVVHELGRDLLHVGALHVGVAEEVVDPLALGAELIEQRRGKIPVLLVDARPLLRHGALQRDPAVLDGVGVDVHGVALHGLPRAGEHERREGQRRDDEDHGDERGDEHPNQAELAAGRGSGRGRVGVRKGARARGADRGLLARALGLALFCAHRPAFPPDPLA